MDNRIQGQSRPAQAKPNPIAQQTRNETARLAEQYRNGQQEARNSRTGAGDIGDIMRAAQGEHTLNSGDKTVRLRATDTAGQRTAKITIASVWENPALIGPDIGNAARGMPAGRSDHANDFAQILFHAFGAEGLYPSYSSSIAMNAESDGRPGNPETGSVTSIPRDRLAAALVETADIAIGGRIEISEAPGAYKVLTGKDAGLPRNLATLIVGFEPKPGIGIDELENVGKVISTILRQESTLVSLGGTENPGSVVVKLAMREGRDPAGDLELLKMLSSEFGGATKTGPNEISSIIDPGARLEAEETLRTLSAQQNLAIEDFDFATTETRFANGVRIGDKEKNKNKYMTSFDEAFRDASPSMRARAADTFDRTWDQLFGEGMRPAHENYVIIDERMNIKTLDKSVGDRDDAPMHWGARMVSLNTDRTGISDLWATELVLNLAEDRALGPNSGDATIAIDRKEDGEPLPRVQVPNLRKIGDDDLAPKTILTHQLIPQGYKPGPKLIKDQGLNSQSYFNLGSYKIPVRNVTNAIAESKRLATETAVVSDMYTNNANCLTYALGLVKEARKEQGPLQGNVEDLEKLDSWINRAFAPDFKAVEPNPDGAAPGTRVSSHYNSVLNQEHLNKLTNPTPGLRPGDTNYSNAVRFLQSISDTTHSPPTKSDVIALAQKFHKLSADQTPTAAQMESALQEVRQWYNDSMSTEIANKVGLERDARGPVKLQDLQDHIFGAPIRADHVTPQRRKSSPT